MESAENEKDYWEQQAELPLHKRSRGWWIEVGTPTIVFTVFVVLFIVGMAYDLLLYRFF